MLIRQGEARDISLDQRLAFTLAAVAGGLNAAAFHAVGFFSANMTGNVSSLSSLFALGQWVHGLGYLLIVLTFVGGATISSLAIDFGLRKGVVTIYAQVVVAEAVMLGLLGMARTALDEADGVPLLVLSLSFLMGLQNAIVTHISDARVRTTHVSGLCTDIGIGLARLIAMFREQARTQEHDAILARLRLHAGTVGSFFVGGIIVVLMYKNIGDLTFSFASLPLIIVAAPPLLATSRT